MNDKKVIVNFNKRKNFTLLLGSVFAVVMCVVLFFDSSQTIFIKIICILGFLLFSFGVLIGFSQVSAKHPALIIDEFGIQDYMVTLGRIYWIDIIDIKLTKGALLIYLNTEENHLSRIDDDERLRVIQHTIDTGLPITFMQDLLSKKVSKIFKEIIFFMNETKVR